MFIMVDLDGTLLKENINWFLFKHVFVSDFFFSLKLIFVFIFYGSNRVKIALSPYLDCFNIDLLVNKKILDFLELQKDSTIVLATGSSEGIAAKVVDKYSVFSNYIASSDSFNCVGVNKLKRILEFTSNQPFFYIGDSYVDLPIWEAASKIGVVNPCDSLLEKIKKLNKEYIVFYV